VSFAAPAGPAEVRAPAPAAVEAVWEGFRSVKPEIALAPVTDESSVPVLPSLETDHLFPLSLPLPGGLLPLDVAAWQRQGQREEVPVLPSLETDHLFPLSLPLPGGLLPLDVAAWQRGVRELFNRLEALAEEPGETASWGRLGPWCAALGGLTIALEIVRRRLSKRYPPDPVALGRGLAWRWSPEPDGGEPPEQP
jgi:hypothetical protein